MFLTRHEMAIRVTYCTYHCKDRVPGSYLMYQQDSISYLNFLGEAYLVFVLFPFQFEITFTSGAVRGTRK